MKFQVGDEVRLSPKGIEFFKKYNILQIIENEIEEHGFKITEIKIEDEFPRKHGIYIRDMWYEPSWLEVIGNLNIIE